MAAYPVRHFRLHRFAGSVICRGVAAGLLTMLLVAIVGVPLPEVRQKSGSEPYPCQDCACGCVSAVHCWDKCCCHSDVEKLAWANEHDVVPPAFLVARVAQQQSESVASSVTPESCCASERSCCSKNLSCCTAKKTVTSAKATSAKATTTQADDTAESVAAEGGVVVVQLDAAAKCRGMKLVWTLLSMVVLGQVRPSYLCPEPCLLFWMCITSDRAASVTLAIDPPVPW